MSTTKRARKRAAPPSNTSSDSSDPETSDMEELLFRARIRLSYLTESLAQFRTELAHRTTTRARRADSRAQQRTELDLQEQEDLRQAREEQRHIEVQEEQLADLGKLFCESELTAEAKTALRHARRRKKSRGRNAAAAHKRRAFDPEMSEVEEGVGIKISSSQQEADEEASRILSGDTARTIADSTPSRTPFNLPNDPFSTPIRPQHLPIPASGSTTRDPSPPPDVDDLLITTTAFNPLSDPPSPTAPTTSTTDRPTTRHPRKAAPTNLSEALLMFAQITPSQIEGDAALPEPLPERRKAGRPRGSKNRVPTRRGGRGARGGLGRGGGYGASNEVSRNDGGDVGSGVNGAGDNGGGEGSAAMGAADKDADLEITGVWMKDESIGAEMRRTPGSTFRPKEELRFMTERKVKQPGLKEFWKNAVSRKSEPADS